MAGIHLQDINFLSMLGKNTSMLTGNNILKGFDRTVGFIDFVQTRNLDQPSDVVGVEFVIDDPFG